MKIKKSSPPSQPRRSQRERPASNQSFMSRFGFMMEASGRRGGDSQVLINFFAGAGTDHRGRTLEQILRWKPHQLETSHDYIQTLFPLPEFSIYNPEASLLDKDAIQAFRNRPDLRSSMGRAFAKILWFYGLEMVDDGTGNLEVVRGVDFEERAYDSWNVPMDHNHKRITRILRCLRLVGLGKEARAFYNALTEFNSGIISRGTLDFWRRAIFRTLNIPPEMEVNDEQDLTIGKEYLRHLAKAEIEAESDARAEQPTADLREHGLKNDTKRVEEEEEEEREEWEGIEDEPPTPASRSES